MNLKQWQRSKKIKAEAEAAAKRTVERVLNAVKEPAMSEFKVGDWVKRTDKITESIYQISSIDKDLIKCNFIKNGESWRLHTTKGEIEFATPEEIAAGHRIDESVDQMFKDAIEHGNDLAMVSIEGVEHVSIAQVIKPFPCEELGDDFPIENRISPLCKSKDV
ncbi:hypothetical protein [Acinetobacter pittii]|uniref:hypothetical protein n=1 Tax=Acinetobacter pittii TaxID=48296 RepID=UPI002A00ABCC|nr:hypothetical protein [Acinetobacter pittii]MDX8160578.1 hypothetical protein [Acinetobacter pittii]MDX8265124.1 hypothetical protein [Acinetobacter pittii]WPP92883.1 hypothetical protein SOI80_04460 [Acinetobacter pittii]